MYASNNDNNSQRHQIQVHLLMMRIQDTITIRQRISTTMQHRSISTTAKQPSISSGIASTSHMLERRWLEPIRMVQQTQQLSLQISHRLAEIKLLLI